jgi:Domain of unknown function (DUF4234)
MTEMSTSAAAPLTMPGAVGNTRSVGLSILWAILTLGIYTLIWTYRTHKEMYEYSGRGVGGVVGLVIYILVSPVTYFLVPSEIKAMYREDGSNSPVTGWWGLWILLPIVGIFVWFVGVQRALNAFWESKGATPAS